MRENQEHYRDLVENSLDLMCTHDLHGVLLTVNLAAARTLGYEPSELINRNLCEFLSPDVRAELDAYLAKLRDNGASSGFMRLRTKSGETRIWKFTNTVRTEGVEVPIVRGIAHDFTDILQAQRALREGEERLRIATEVGRMYAWEWDPATDSVQRSSECAGILGLTSAAVESVGKDYLSLIHPDDRAKLWTLATSLTPDEPTYRTEYRRFRTDGALLWLEESGRGKFDEAGKMVRLIGMTVDVTERKQVEAELSASEERNRQFVRKSPIAMLVVRGLEQKNELVNEKFTDLFGYSKEDVPSVAQWWSLAYPDKEYRETVMQEWQARVAEAIKNHSEITPMEAKVCCKDGSYRYIEFHFTSLGETQLVSFVDLTSRKQAEEQVRESQGQLSRMVASAMDAIISVDDKQLIVLFNGSAEKMFGCRADEAIGSSIDRFIPARFRSEHHAHIRRFGESGVANRGMGGLGTVRGVRANGEEFPVEASISSIQVGGKKLFTTIVRDVSERFLAEEVLRESEERFRLVADTAPVLIWMSGTDKMCIFFNKGWLDFTGRSMEQEWGEGWTSGVHPDDLERCLGIYSSAFDSRVDFQMEYRLRRFDGQYRWIVDYGIPRFESNGIFCGYIGSCVDVTHRKLSETSLRELSGRLIHAQEEERARIARELHDDLSQRMALLQISLDQFQQQIPGLSSQSRQQLQSIKEVATEVSSTIHDLSHQLHPFKLDALGLVAAVEGFCRELSDRHNLKIQFVHRDIPGIPKDATLCLFRIVQEALRNVVKHSGAAEAKVELSVHGDRIDLCVSDSGAGFNPESAKGVAGLGLISMRERLRLVGGQLSVESVPSRGTQIRVRIPLLAPADS